MLNLSLSLNPASLRESPDHLVEFREVWVLWLAAWPPQRKYWPLFP